MIKISVVSVSKKIKFFYRMIYINIKEFQNELKKEIH